MLGRWVLAWAAKSLRFQFYMLNFHPRTLVSWPDHLRLFRPMQVTFPLSPQCVSIPQPVKVSQWPLHSSWAVACEPEVSGRHFLYTTSGVDSLAASLDKEGWRSKGKHRLWGRGGMKRKARRIRGWEQEEMWVTRVGKQDGIHDTNSG